MKECPTLKRFVSEVLQDVYLFIDLSKINFLGNVGPCRDRAWAFERHPGKELRGMDERTIPLVATRRDCQEACLKETRFVCRSARYDTKTLDCKLSSNDKRLRPDVFMNADSQTVEYLENQCAGLGKIKMSLYFTIFLIFIN